MNTEKKKNREALSKVFTQRLQTAMEHKGYFLTENGLKDFASYLAGEPEKLMPGDAKKKTYDSKLKSLKKYFYEGTIPDIETINDIANQLDCTVDYLLGHDNRPLPVNEETGLNTTAINRIKNYDTEHKKLLNELISCDTDILDYLLSYLLTYIYDCGKGAEITINNIFGKKTRTGEEAANYIMQAYTEQIENVFKIVYDLHRKNLSEKTRLKIQEMQAELSKHKQALEKAKPAFDSQVFKRSEKEAQEYIKSGGTFNELCETEKQSPQETE